jgi:hypothetical protein
VAAPDPPYHGELRRRGIRFASLKDYVEAVDTAAAELGRPLVLVGHSMAGYTPLNWSRYPRPALWSHPPAGDPRVITGRQSGG